jgi:hypothetical protein
MATETVANVAVARQPEHMMDEVAKVAASFDIVEMMAQTMNVKPAEAAPLAAVQLEAGGIGVSLPAVYSSVEAVAVHGTDHMCHLTRSLPVRQVARSFSNSPPGCT